MHVCTSLLSTTALAWTGQWWFKVLLAPNVLCKVPDVALLAEAQISLRLIIPGHH